MLSGQIRSESGLKNRRTDRIQKRLQVLVNLQDTLENGFSFFLFSKAKVPRYSKIDAEYLIRNNHSGEMFFVFLDKESGRYFCKSAFGSEMDYSRNQTPLTLLYKCRVEEKIRKFYLSTQSMLQTLYKKEILVEISFYNQSQILCINCPADLAISRLVPF